VSDGGDTRQVSLHPKHRFQATTKQLRLYERRVKQERRNILGRYLPRRVLPHPAFTIFSLSNQISITVVRKGEKQERSNILGIYLGESFPIRHSQYFLSNQTYMTVVRKASEAGAQQHPRRVLPHPAFTIFSLSNQTYMTVVRKGEKKAKLGPG